MTLLVRVLVFVVAPPPGSVVMVVRMMRMEMMGLTRAHPGRGVHGYVNPVVIMRDPGENARQSHPAARRPVRDQPYQLRAKLPAVFHQRRAGVPRAGAAQVLPYDAHLAGGLLLRALPEVVLLDRHRGQVELRGWILPVQPPAAHPGRGAGGVEAPGQADGPDVGEGGRAVLELHHGDVVGQGGVRPEGPAGTEVDTAARRQIRVDNNAVVVVG